MAKRIEKKLERNATCSLELIQQRKKNTTKESYTTYGKKYHLEVYSTAKRRDKLSLQSL